MNDEIRRPKIRDQVAVRIRDFITSQQLQAGDRLPTETQLATSFGVSRLSVREATKTLEYMGVIRSKPGMGLSVGDVNLQRIAELMAFHPALRAATRSQLIETRIIVELGVLPLVAVRMRDDPATCDALQSVVDQMRTVREASTWIELDVEFHRSLVVASQLTPLFAFNELLTVFFQEFRESAQRPDRNEWADSHQRLIDLLRDQQLELARSELRAHIETHKTPT